MSEGSAAVERRLRAGDAAAQGPRRRVRRRLRSLRARLVRWLLRRKRWDGTDARRPTVGHVRWVPGPRTPEERADLQARWSWYLEDLDLGVANSWSPAPASAAPWMAPRLVEAGGRAPTPGRVSAPAGLLLHRVTAGSLATALRHPGPVAVVDDDHFHISDVLGYEQVRASRGAVAEAGTLSAVWPDDGVPRRALVVATGPSLAELDLSTIRQEVRITCNSAVRDAALLRALDPHLIAFADPVFHFGPSLYAHRFREDVARALELTRAHLLVPDRFAALLLHHVPAAQGRVVAFGPTAREWTWPTSPADPVVVRGTDNILTLAMLPAAFALAEVVEVAGSTGRQPDERYFWQHNRATQYPDEVMQTAFAAHRSFFRDRLYDDYYEHHCAELDDLVRVAESRGKTVRSITTSWIPALHDRGHGGRDG